MVADGVELARQGGGSIAVADYALGLDLLKLLGQKRNAKSIFRIGRFRLAHFRLAYCVALESDMFTEAERLGSARCVFESILAGSIDDVPLATITSDADGLRKLVRRQVMDELGMDPLLADAARNQTVAPPRAEDIYELLKSQYGQPLPCPPADEPCVLEDGSELTDVLVNTFRLLWSRKSSTMTVPAAKMMFGTSHGGALSVYGPSELRSHRILTVAERALEAGCFRSTGGFVPSRSAISAPKTWGPWWTLMMTTARREMLTMLLPGKTDPRLFDVVRRAISDLSDGQIASQEVRRVARECGTDGLRIALMPRRCRPPCKLGSSPSCSTAASSGAHGRMRHRRLQRRRRQRIGLDRKRPARRRRPARLQPRRSLLRHRRRACRRS